MAFIPNDPRFANQWHLLNDTNGQFDLNVVDAWDDYDGSGVRVAVIDRGFDYNHPDFDNYRTDLDWDFEDGDAVALPDVNEGDNHGTPVMGIIGAAADGEGTVGVAFGADLIGYKTDWSRDQIEDAINLAVTANHDVVSMSYGEGSGVFQDRDGLISAVNNALANGRTVGGVDLGTVLVKSSGNSRAPANNALREEGTAEAIDSHRGTISVAAVRQDGQVTDFSTPGANVLVSAFADDLNNNPSISTTDNTGAAGYTNTDYTNTFGGTSAAAPQVAGVVALMLEANPDLGWRDVQSILSYSARHVGSDVGAAAQGFEQGTAGAASWRWNDADNWNGGGLHVSNDYGFGLVDAKAAVRLAETWTSTSTSANDATTFQDGLNGNVTIANGSASGGSNFFNINEATNIRIEHVSLEVEIVSAADLADLEVYLTSPQGTRIQLIADTGDTQNYSGEWRFGATGFRGEMSAGMWTVEVRDDDSAISSPIVINDLDLRTYGSSVTNDDLFIFTNEFSDYAGVAGHSTNFAGGAGSDTINVSAVNAASIINLQIGQGVIDGVAVTMSSIQDVYGGDHQDIIFDGAGSNDIYGMRGNDILRDTTAGGNDRYYGGEGNDTIQVYSAIAADAFYGGAGSDTINWAQSGETSATFDLAGNEARDSNGNTEVMSSFANIVGTAYGDTIIESNATNDIDGYDGDDTVIVTTAIAADAFHGGSGRDTIDWSAVSENGATFNLATGLATDSVGNTEVMDSFENIVGTENDDTIIESIAANDINARGGDDLVTVTSAIGSDSFRGGFGNDTIDWSGSSQANGVYNFVLGRAISGANEEIMEGFENFIGTNQADTIIEGNGPNVIHAGGGNDTVEVTTVIGVDSFTGGFGTDTIDWSGSTQANGVYNISGGTATSGRNQEIMSGFENFIGTNQRDIIIEGNGTNVINAGGGNDTVEVHTAIGVDSFDGGFGNDTIDWSGSSQANGVYDISDGTATSGNNVETMFGFENFIGTNQRDIIIEGAGTNVIDAGGGDDTVEVNTTIGVDSFTGGFGTDTIDWSGSSQVNGTYDLSGGTASAGGQSETMFGFENFIGTSQRDIIIEGVGTNVIDAGAGNDIVTVGTIVGVDSYDGGAGIDLIDWSGVNQGGISFNLGTGTATAGGGQVETMTHFENFYGTDLNDNIRGSSDSNLLRGMDGDDAMRGLQGHDLMAGGDGNDNMRGNGGSDTLSGDAGNDTLRGGGGGDTLLDGDGRDQMFGQGGADTFSLIVDDFIDRVRDFALGSDLIELTGFDYDDLNIVDMASGNVRIFYGTDSVILNDNDDTLAAADFSSDDFLFV
ncbi:S8 family serine peptidase [Sedimentitalea todarodis]|uniref:S8 family serine peptidase n=1 Tax=Sedimentitalea todarodis TaxID=1631240 RepID=A0ABU3VBZ5_9RHOB|nr:S8 family serine peptidase [Sedimentitalea todarodis]MDU9003677.1 S8 family serine peptidase [Sedimentitalea todarodis]